MVTKLAYAMYDVIRRLNLAKIHMVTKPIIIGICDKNSLNLAKIHMVTKQPSDGIYSKLSLNLAKIHMVTKHRS